MRAPIAFEQLNGFVYLIQMSVSSRSWQARRGRLGKLDELQVELLRGDAKEARPCSTPSLGIFCLAGTGLALSQPLGAANWRRGADAVCRRGFPFRRPKSAAGACLGIPVCPKLSCWGALR